MTRNCGASERLVDGVHCIKIELTESDLAAAMRSVTVGHVDLARMGRAARRLVESDLSFSRSVDRVEAILGGHSKRPWQSEMCQDPSVHLLAFLKHNLSISLRYG
jgi:hypothetical protein